MLSIISKLLREKADDIDAGNTRLSEEQQYMIMDMMARISNPKEKLSKEQALKYLKDHNCKISRATFDNYVAEGLLPKGIKEAGYKELSWYKKDLDKFIKERKQCKQK